MLHIVQNPLCSSLSPATYARLHPSGAYMHFTLGCKWQDPVSLWQLSLPLLSCASLTRSYLLVTDQTCLLLLSCRQPSKASINAVRIKPSSAQNSSSQEQGEPPTKKQKGNEVDMGNGAPSQSKASPAAVSEAPASLPTASQASKGHSASKAEAPQASLTAMLGNCRNTKWSFLL